jgi:hypothetical protein
MFIGLGPLSRVIQFRDELLYLACGKKMVFKQLYSTRSLNKHKRQVTSTRTHNKQRPANPAYKELLLHCIVLRKLHNDKMFDIANKFLYTSMFRTTTSELRMFLLAFTKNLGLANCENILSTFYEPWCRIMQIMHIIPKSCVLNLICRKCRNTSSFYKLLYGLWRLQGDDLVHGVVCIECMENVGCGSLYRSPLKTKIH